MPNDAARFDAMLFDYKTTTNNDFKTLKFEPIIKSFAREKKSVRPAYKNIKDIRTLIEWNGPTLPFDLLWGPPKAILRTDPRRVQQPVENANEHTGHLMVSENWPIDIRIHKTAIPKTANALPTLRTKMELCLYASHFTGCLLPKPEHNNENTADAKPEDLGRREAQRTRPRQVMTPAVSMDDIENEEYRTMLTEDTYRSSAQIAMREGVALTKNNNIRAPFPGRNSPANPISLGRVKPSRVPLEWRRDTISWDYNQLRTFVAPEREFWLRHGSLYKDCRSCKETAQIKKTRDMAKKLPI